MLGAASRLGPVGHLPAGRDADKEDDMPRGPARSAYGETRMLGEYLAFQYPNYEVWQRMRLGALLPATPEEALTEDELALVGVFRRWADAVAVGAGELVVIEAKMRSSPGAISQLQLYDSLVPHTPELVDYLGLRRRLELVVAIDDPAVRRLAAVHNVGVRVFRPDWLPEWAAAMHRREVRPPRDFGTVGV